MKMKMLIGGANEYGYCKACRKLRRPCLGGCPVCGGRLCSVGAVGIPIPPQARKKGGKDD